MTPLMRSHRTIGSKALLRKHFSVCAPASPVFRRSIVDGRMETGKPVLLLDWDGDVKYLNNRISEHMTFGSVLAEGETFPLQLG